MLPEYGVRKEMKSREVENIKRCKQQEIKKIKVTLRKRKSNTLNCPGTDKWSKTNKSIRSFFFITKHSVNDITYNHKFIMKRVIFS